MKIEIFSDVACPFCYIGQKHLTTALEQLGRTDDVEIRWRAFQLDPNAGPADGMNAETSLALRKGMPVEQVQQMMENVRQRGAEAGLEMNPAGAIPANTRDAHRLVHLAREHGLEHEMQMRLFQAHFQDGVDVSLHGVLAELAEDVGIPAEEVAALWDGDRFDEEVRFDQQEAGSFGVQGVPFFVIDRKYGLSGAQPVETFKAALSEAFADRN